MPKRLLGAISIVSSLGLAVFAIDYLMYPRTLFQPPPKPEIVKIPSDEPAEVSYVIEITEELIKDVTYHFAIQRETSPYKIYQKPAVEDYIEEEILVREALRRNLHLRDHIVREILAEKASLLLDAKPIPPEAPEDVLQQAYQKNINDFRLPGRYTLRQIFIKGIDADAKQHAEELLESLKAGLEKMEAYEQSDPPPGGPVLRGRTLHRLKEIYGQQFVDGLEQVELDTWHLRESEQGIHIVKLLKRREQRTLSFEEARSRIANMWQNDWLRENSKDELEALKSQYTVIGWPRDAVE